MKKILKKYLKITGGFYYPKIEDKEQFNNINSEKIIRMDKKDFILVDSEGYIVDITTSERIEDIITTEPIKYIDAFFLNGYIYDINTLYKYIKKQEKEGKRVGEISDYYRNYILYDDLVKILNFKKNREKQSQKLLKKTPEKILKKISINISSS